MLVKPAQLLRLLNHRVQLKLDTYKLDIILIVNNFNDFKTKKDFDYFEDFTGKSILVYIKNIILTYPSKPFAIYFKVRNALFYLLKSDRYLELLELDTRILSYLEKETRKIFNFYIMKF